MFFIFLYQRVKSKPIWIAKPSSLVSLQDERGQPWMSHQTISQMPLTSPMMQRHLEIAPMKKSRSRGTTSLLFIASSSWWAFQGMQWQFPLTFSECGPGKAAPSSCWTWPAQTCSIWAASLSWFTTTPAARTGSSGRHVQVYPLRLPFQPVQQHPLPYLL